MLSYRSSLPVVVRVYACGCWICTLPAIVDGGEEEREIGHVLVPEPEAHEGNQRDGWKRQDGKARGVRYRQRAGCQQAGAFFSTFDGTQQQRGVDGVAFEIEGICIANEWNSPDEPILELVEGHVAEHAPRYVQLSRDH